MILQIIKNDFGQYPDQLFEHFEHEPIASASIAQVHRARLNGRDVAVKVQKRAIQKQVRVLSFFVVYLIFKMEWDLWCYRTLLRMAEYWFGYPVAFIGDCKLIAHVTDR